MRSLHGQSSTEQCQWAQFLQQRAGYMGAGEFLVELLKSRNDPRLTIYFTSAQDADTVRGAPPGVGDTKASTLNPAYLAADDASIDLLSFEENNLIIAECQYYAGNEAEALAALNDVRTALESKWGLDAGTYPALTGLTGEDLLHAILEEKYISLFLNIEVWNDYKRNCYPELVPYGGVKIPGRILYSDAEVQANRNVPADPLRNDNDPNVCP
ncbi:MAG: SusD/RagB family nutrient-binding outer membrane lipoprotein [Candidatus Neomarinimicrobiota bacterium]